MTVSKMILRVSLFLSLVATFSGCANQGGGDLTHVAIQGAINAIGASLGGTPSGVVPAGGTIFGAPAESSFKNILISSTGSTQWPHVALTITALPQSAYKNMIMTWGSSVPQTACMRLSAVVWSDMRTSRVIPEETFCASQMRPTSINSLGETLSWGSFEERVAKPSNTGYTRTNGPLPPAKLFPEGADYKSFYQSQVRGTFGVLIRMMGYDLSILGEKDRRLWVVSIPTEVEINSGQKVLR